MMERKRDRERERERKFMVCIDGERKEREKGRERERQRDIGFIINMRVIYFELYFGQILVLKNSVVNIIICNLVSFSEYMFEIRVKLQRDLGNIIGYWSVFIRKLFKIVGGCKWLILS